MQRKGFAWTIAAVLAVGAVATACGTGPADTARGNSAERSATETAPPFGGPANVAYAEDLWSALREARLVGPGAIQARPYQGQEPHGAVLVTLERPLVVQGHMGLAIVKKNFLGEGVSVERVANEPTMYLDSITVMYQREKGYDPEHENWYWAKYAWDGSLQANAQGARLAGRVAKGAEAGCIACHRSAPGGDYIFNHDRLAGG